MNSPEEVISYIIECLDRADVPYMIAGSFASNLYGVPRATQDADIILEIDPTRLQLLHQFIGGDFYFPDDSAKEAVDMRGMFNVIHMQTGFKLDFIVKKDRPFSAEEFKRRRRAVFAGRECWFSSPEDSILSKLEWAKKGESERQFRDAAGIAKILESSLDVEYLGRWAVPLGISDLLDRLLSEIYES